MADDFRAKDVITDAVNRTLGVLRAYSRGDTVPWAVIEGAAGFARRETHWQAYWVRLRKKYLKDTGVCLWPVYSVGMKLLTAHEQLTTRSAARRRRAYRQLRRDEQELKAVPEAELTVHQCVLRDRQIEAAQVGKRQVMRQLRIGHALTKAQDKRVRPPIVATA